MISIGENEKIHLIKRRHSFVLFSKIISLAIVFFLFLVLFFFVSFSSTNESIREIFEKTPFIYNIEVNFYFLTLFLLSLFLLYLVQSIFFIFTHYYLDCWVITNERIIHTELRGPFSLFSSTVPLNKIQDITVDICGFFPMVFKYGDLKIQTAGGLKKFIFHQISNPHEAKNFLIKTRNAKEKESNYYSRSDP